MTEFAIEQVEAALRARLGEKAAGHCLRVGETAGSLAAAYGVDVHAAVLAGMLHDWDRELTGDELLEAASVAGLKVSAADQAVPYLLHARTGADALRSAFPGIDEAIIQAVGRHTVGSVDMSDLDMVVYLADMMEPARDFAGVQELRDAVGAVPLQELFALGYQHSVAHLVQTRRRLHPDTVGVWNALVAGGTR